MRFSIDEIFRITTCNFLCVCAYDIVIYLNCDLKYSWYNQMSN